jgi:hypothetical protein
MRLMTGESENLISTLQHSLHSTFNLYQTEFF